MDYLFGRELGSVFLLLVMMSINLEVRMLYARRRTAYPSLIKASQ